MPTVAVAELPDASTHPLAVFLSNFQDARDLLIREQIEQEGIMKDGNATSGERVDASANVLDLTEAIAQLDNARTEFLVRVFTGVIPPSEALVAQTIKLNKRLAVETVKANRTGTYIKIVASFVTAATQVITGNVPPVEDEGE